MEGIGMGDTTGEVAGGRSLNIIMKGPGGASKEISK